jgi:hypothetical protein
MSADGDAPELLQVHLDRDASDVTSWYTTACAVHMQV